MWEVISDVNVLNRQVIACQNVGNFCAELIGQTISNMTRKGKFLTFHFESGDWLSLHLRMTGQLLVMLSDYEMEKHTHLVFALDDNNQIRYIDVRRFGRFWFLKGNEADFACGTGGLSVKADKWDLKFLMHLY